MLKLSSKTCLVTGATGGIGSATVRLLHSLGARVLVHYAQDEAGAHRLAQELGGDRIQLLQADLATEQGAFALWRSALACCPRIDVLVNNAAIASDVPLDAEEDIWHAAWQRMLRVNLMAVADLCREAVAHFRVHGGGSIVNVSSRAAFRGDSLEYMHYAASKAGVIALTRSLARGCAAEGILAYAVAPGFVDTTMAEPFIREYGLPALTRDIPMGEMVPPQEVANVIAFLASGLARHATGATIDLNGASYVR